VVGLYLNFVSIFKTTGEDKDLGPVITDKIYSSSA
jgi:hypothetical protein